MVGPDDGKSFLAETCSLSVLNVVLCWLLVLFIRHR